MEAITTVTLQLTADEAAYIEVCWPDAGNFLLSPIPRLTARFSLSARMPPSKSPVSMLRACSPTPLLGVCNTPKKGQRPASAPVVGCDKAEGQTNAPC